MRLSTLFLAFCFIILPGCSSQESNQLQVSSEPEKSSGDFIIPSEIQTAALPAGTLRAHLYLDSREGQAIASRDLTPDQSEVTFAQLSVPSGQHSFIIVFEFETQSNNNYELAHATSDVVDLSPGSTQTISFPNSYTYPDSDGDDLNNLTELENGTDPENDDVVEPVTTPSQSGGRYNSVTVTFSCNDGSNGSGCATTYYTIDPNIQPDQFAEYTGTDIEITGDTNIRFYSIDNAGNVEAVRSEEYIIDTVAPIANAPSLAGQILANTYVIEITFDESMATNSISFQGDLGSDATAVWSQTNVANDTVSISPSIRWSLGDDQTLIIDAADVAGNAVATINFTLNIATLYVSEASGQDTDSSGSKQSPMFSIQAAISKVSSTYGQAIIRASEGSYVADYSIGTQIRVPDGVQLYGGYSSDWSIRDPTVYSTRLRDNFNTGSGTTISNPARSLEIIGPTPNETVVDGFEIWSVEGATFASAIFVANAATPRIENNRLSGFGVHNSAAIIINNASPLIRNNSMYHDNDTTNAYTIYVDAGAAPIIESNTIECSYITNINCTAVYNNASSPTIIANDIAVVGDRGVVKGIVNDSSQAVIRNNVIKVTDAGFSPPGDFYAIQDINASQSIIQNNTITGCIASTTNVGISINSQSTPIIENNLIDCGQCVVEENVNADPIAVNNNNMYCLNFVYIDMDLACGGGTNSNCSLNELNNLTDMEASGNVWIFPNFVGPNDYHLTTNSGVLNSGGKDLSAEFTTDKDNVTRVPPWSIGAYE